MVVEGRGGGSNGGVYSGVMAGGSVFHGRGAAVSLLSVAFFTAIYLDGSGGEEVLAADSLEMALGFYRGFRFRLVSYCMTLFHFLYVVNNQKQ